MIVEFDGDIPTAIGKHIAGVEVPSDLLDVAAKDWSRLRLVDGRMVDGDQFAAFYIDSSGRKHASKIKGLPLVQCRIHDEIVQDSAGKWRVVTPDEIAAAEEAVEWRKVRDRRNALLAACDWTQLPDNRLGPVARREWADYRQALRDITRAGRPTDVVWPASPGG